MLLITFRDNYADEFDIDGWFVAEESVWEKFKQQELPEDRWNQGKPWRHSTGKYFEIYFGSNEGIEYSSLEAYFKHFTTKTITDVQAQVIIDLFGAQLILEEDNGETYFVLDPSGTVLNPFD